MCPVPLDAGLTARLIEGAAKVPADERETLADSWLDARDPANAVRENTSAAEEKRSRLRVVALELAEIAREDGWPAWREIAGDDARPQGASRPRVPALDGSGAGACSRGLAVGGHRGRRGGAP